MDPDRTPLMVLVWLRGVTQGRRLIIRAPWRAETRLGARRSALAFDVEPLVVTARGRDAHIALRHRVGQRECEPGIIQPGSGVEVRLHELVCDVGWLDASLAATLDAAIATQSEQAVRAVLAYASVSSDAARAAAAHADAAHTHALELHSFGALRWMSDARGTFAFDGVAFVRVAHDTAGLATVLSTVPRSVPAADLHAGVAAFLRIREPFALALVAPDANLPQDLREDLVRLGAPVPERAVRDGPIWRLTYIVGDSGFAGPGQGKESELVLPLHTAVDDILRVTWDVRTGEVRRESVWTAPAARGAAD